MVGGGQGAFIGGVHRIAARLDGRYELVAGAFSATAEKSKASGEELGVGAGALLRRFRRDGQAGEAAQGRDRRGGDRHAEPRPLRGRQGVPGRGIHVICDKPLTTTLKDARKLAELVEKSGCVFALTHNYTGYPMVRQARQMVADGAAGPDPGGAGRVRPGLAHHQARGHRPEAGRMAHRPGPLRARRLHRRHRHPRDEPRRFITGLGLESLAADLATFLPGRPLDDNAHVMLRFAGGAKGMLWASQVAPGNENALRVRVYGERGGLEWAQEDPNYLRFTPYGQPPQLIRRGGAGCRRGGGAGDPHPGRPSRGLSRRLRQPLQRRRRADLGQARGPRAGPGGDAGADGPRRRRGRQVHRGRGRVRAARTAPGSGRAPRCSPRARRQ